MTVVYEDEWVKLIHGNYRDHVDELTGLDVDAVCTDPPYGETSLDWDRWPTGWPDDAARIADVLWCFGSFKMFWNHRPEFAAWKHSQEIVWEKHNGSGFANDRFKRVHELAVMFYQGDWGGGSTNRPQRPRTPRPALFGGRRDRPTQDTSKHPRTRPKTAVPGSCAQCSTSDRNMAARSTRHRSPRASCDH